MAKKLQYESMRRQRKLGAEKYNQRRKEQIKRKQG